MSDLGDEFTEELEHQREMLRILRRRRRERERQAAQYGIDVPPHVSNEIQALDDQIHQKDAEVSRLATLAAVEKIPVPEAEYRKILAEDLDATDGYLSFVVSTKIELARLRLGLVADRAREIEEEVRRALGEETLFYVGDNLPDKFRIAEKEAINSAYSEQRRLISSLRSSLEILMGNIHQKESDYPGKIPDKFIDSKIEECRRNIIAKSQEINQHLLLFPGLRKMKSIEDAEVFVNLNARQYLEQEGKSVNRTFITNKIIDRLQRDVHRIMRAVRLDRKLSLARLAEILNTKPDIELVIEIIELSPSRPSDRAVIDSFIHDLRVLLQK